MHWRRLLIFAIMGIATVLAALGWRLWRLEEVEQRHMDRDETPVSIGIAASGVRCEIYAADSQRGSATLRGSCSASTLWLPAGRYFIEATHSAGKAYYPVTILGYRLGPDREGAFLITIRPWPAHRPEGHFAYIPSGHFLIGDRANPQEPHYVWLPAYFIGAFEVTNSEFRAFLTDASGYPSDANWTEEGRRWRSATACQASALLRPGDDEYRRFGRDDQPVTSISWFEAMAYCRWLTKQAGAREWTFTLPTDAEWEKAARGPDQFDYGLGEVISDAERSRYNWGKNPDAPVTVVGWGQTTQSYPPNRYGIYHASGNVAEWTSSAFWPYSRQLPYTEEGRNSPDLNDRRTVRGGSWYSATSAPLYLPYRDGFQPSRRGNDIGFRLVAKAKP